MLGVAWLPKETKRVWVYLQLFACPPAWQSSAQLTPATLVPAVTLPQQELLPLTFSLVDTTLLLHPVTDGTCKRLSGCRLIWSQVLAVTTLTETGEEL